MPVGVCCGSCGAGAVECGRWNGGIIETIFFGYLLFAAMTSTTDRNDLMPAQEKLEWVTPKIALMKAGETHGKYANQDREGKEAGAGPS